MGRFYRADCYRLSQWAAPPAIKLDLITGHFWGFRHFCTDTTLHWGRFRLSARMDATPASQDFSRYMLSESGNAAANVIRALRIQLAVTISQGRINEVLQHTVHAASSLVPA